MAKGAAGTVPASQSLLDSWKAAGSPELVTDPEEPEVDDIPLEAEGEDDVLPLEDETDPEAQSPESGTAESTDNQWPTDLPKTYFGRSLEEYAEANGLEAAKAYYTALQDATKDYNRRLEELAEERKHIQQVPQDRQQPPGGDEPDVEAIFREFGINASNPYAEEIKDDVLAPMARMIAEIRSGQETQASSVEADRFERDFFSGLEATEKEFGEPLPLERADILDYAINRDIYSPRALYLTVMGPVWKAEAAKQTTTATKAQKTAAEATKKAKQAASRAKGRRSSAPDATSKPAKKGSIEDAARAAARSLGRTVVKMEK